MNKLFALLSILLLSFSFVLAVGDQPSVQTAQQQQPQLVNSDQSRAVAPSVHIFLGVPAEDYMVQEVDSSATVRFEFEAKSDFAKEHTLNDGSVVLYDEALSCDVIVRKDDLNVLSTETTFDFMTGSGKMEDSFVVGSYKWHVSCANEEGTWNSEERIFTVYPFVQSKQGSMVELISPVDQTVFETSQPSFLVDFMFSIKPELAQNRDDLKCSLFVRTNDADVREFEASLDLDSEEGKAQETLALGSYKWYVSCSDGMQSWNSEERILRIASPPVVDSSTGGSSNNPTTTTQGGSSSSSNDEGSGRRLPVNAGSALNPLSNPTSDGSGLNTLSNSDDSQPAGITGAVIGALGRKGALGMGIFITLVGIVALAVYNRERLGLVKN